MDARTGAILDIWDSLRRAQAPGEGSSCAVDLDHGRLFVHDRTCLLSHALQLAHVLGGYEGGSTVDGTSDDTWRRMLDINLLRNDLPAVAAGLASRGAALDTARFDAPANPAGLLPEIPARSKQPFDMSQGKRQK